MQRITGSDKPTPVETSPEQALSGVQECIGTLDTARGQLARLYVRAGTETSIEHEVGESLQAVRKAIKRLRDARDELAQAYHQSELPLQ